MDELSSMDSQQNLHGRNACVSTFVCHQSAFGCFNRLGFVSLFLLLVAPPGYSAPVPSLINVGEEGLRRQEQIQAELQKSQQQFISVLSVERKAKRTDVLPQESLCFEIDQIRLVGDAAEELGWLESSVNRFSGQCIGVKGAQHIVHFVDEALLTHGYVTSRTSLPPQNLSQGVLRLNLHMGRVGDLRLTVPSESADLQPLSLTEKAAFPVISGDWLNIRDLEQGVENANRFQSQQLTMRIEPGAQPDSSDIIFDKQLLPENRLRGGLGLSNAGSKSISRGQLSGFLTYENPFELNDLFNISLNSNAEQLNRNNRTQSVSYQYSIPWGYNALSVSQTFSRFAQKVSGTTTQFTSSGRSKQTELTLERTVLRSASAKLSIYGTLHSRRANSYLDDVELMVQRRKTTHFTQGLHLKKHFSHGGVSNLDIAYQQGRGWFNAEADLPSAEQGGLTLRPDIWHAELDYKSAGQIASIPISYSSVLNIQYTDDPVITSEQFSIGSRYSVRGFDGDNVLLAESGAYWRNEFSTPSTLASNAHWYVALDAGRVWGDSDESLLGRKLVGMAIGWRGQWSSLYLDAALSGPLYKPVNFETQALSPYLSAIYSF